MFCETTHDKSKLDGIGGFIKSFASRSVCEKKQSPLMARELYDFLCEQMFVNSTYDSTKPMLESFI